MKKIKNTFTKFIFIWIISTLINYIIFILLYNIWINYILSSSIWYISGLIFWYYINKNYNFNIHNKNSFIKYILIYFTNLILSLFILYILVEYININIYISNFLILIYTTISNYIWLKFYVFKINN